MIEVRKNILFGFALLSWPLALVIFLTSRDQLTLEERRLLSWSWITQIGIAALGIFASIPYIGWALGGVAEVVLTVFWVIAVVKVFMNRLDYKMILVSKISDAIIKE